MTNQSKQTKGLTTAQAQALQLQFGKNQLIPTKKQSFFKKILHVIAEPMFLLLLLAAIIYFILGEPRDGAIMLIFVIGIISIDVIQEWKTDKTLEALKDLSAPHITVIRDDVETEIAAADLVPGDLMLIQEGIKIPADGVILKCNDLCVDESSLTGEALGVWKIPVNQEQASADYWRQDYCYAGTLVTQGTGIVQVEAIGTATEYGKIGQNIASAPEELAPLQKQTGALVKTCAGIAAVLFAAVGFITWFNLPDLPFSNRLIESILSGVTLAMAMIPEEFPVILTIFLSMGAWRLAKKQSLVRRLPAVETLGAVSVLCVDKTGTITMNKMSVQETWAVDDNTARLCEIMGLGCETDPYDPMEQAMISHCEQLGIPASHLFGGSLITEYPFTNELKMMGHIWHHDGEIIIAAKGSPESILKLCNLTPQQQKETELQIGAMSQKGLRVIAAGVQKPTKEQQIPPDISQCQLEFCGIVGFADPPRPTVKTDIALCTKAGIRVVMITGDNGITAAGIAKQISMSGTDNIITGQMLDAMTDEELQAAVKTANIFSRVIPEHKMRIVKALKNNGEIVAMTGDGVNDAPALKYADIGIAMGKHGSEVSREAADLILLDDNFSTIVDTIRDGRRIYDNIRKAVGYVFAIHLPIATASLLAPLLHIAPANLMFLPLHVVLMELLIDPTCSIVLERQPMESDVMAKPPRSSKAKMLTARLLGKSILQGIVIFAAAFGSYYFTLKQTGDSFAARTIGLGILMLSNLFLVLVNSSNHDFAWQSLKRLAKDKVMWGVTIATITMLALVIYSPLNSFLKLEALSLNQLLIMICLSIIAVFWYELIKLYKKLKVK